MQPLTKQKQVLHHVRRWQTCYICVNTERKSHLLHHKYLCKCVLYDELL